MNEEKLQHATIELISHEQIPVSVEAQRIGNIELVNIGSRARASEQALISGRCHPNNSTILVISDVQMSRCIKNDISGNAQREIERNLLSSNRRAVEFSPSKSLNPIVHRVGHIEIEVGVDKDSPRAIQLPWCGSSAATSSSCAHRPRHAVSMSVAQTTIESLVQIDE